MTNKVFTHECNKGDIYQCYDRIFLVIKTRGIYVDYIETSSDGYVGFFTWPNWENAEKPAVFLNNADRIFSL